MTSSPPVDPPVHRVPSGLSPSRAADFKTCPLLYRLRSIDRIPEPPTLAAARGTLVHTVLERLYELPAPDRQLVAATSFVEPAWAQLRETTPEIDDLFQSPSELAAWLTGARDLVAGYFTVEDPTRLQPAAREEAVEVELASGLRLRGIVDRLDIAPTGAIRVVDYKSGSAPRATFEAKALFQLKFYALVIWRTRQVVPAALRLVYLADREVLDYQPTESELLAFERTLEALWRAIQRAIEAKEFAPNPSKLCGWCPYQHLCPAHQGNLPPFPELAMTDSSCEDPES